jgi:protein-disulfide isomerase
MWRSLLDIVATSTMAIASVAIAWFLLTIDRGQNQPAEVTSRRRADSPLPGQPLSLDGAALGGNRLAPLAVIEYSDFRCAHCGRFARETLPTVWKRYVETGKLLYAIRLIASESRGSEGFKAAEASLCGERQGKFWELHGLLFSEPLRIDETYLIRRAREAGLDMPAFTSCVAGQVRDRLSANVAEARRLGISGTPTFLFGRSQPDGSIRVLQRRTGALTLEAFEQILGEVRKDIGVGGAGP